MWLSWQVAMQMAIVLVVVALIGSRLRSPSRAVTTLVAVSRETALVLGLYALWQYAHDLAVHKTEGAIEHAHWVWNFERRWHFPSELSIQQAFLPHPVLTKALDIYYAVAHVPAVGILLVWLFFRHRDRYPRVRTSLALMIGGCLLIQMVPVAPPRFLTDLGFVDVGLRDGLSVYGTGGSGISNQVAAMPSHHMGWAVLVGIAVVTISTSRWRWFVLLHPVLTLLAVVATANHWWLDGVVAWMVLGVGYALQLAVVAVLARVRRSEAQALAPAGQYLSSR